MQKTYFKKIAGTKRPRFLEENDQNFVYGEIKQMSPRRLTNRGKIALVQKRDPYTCDKAIPS